MDLYFQLKLHSAAATYKIAHLMWREKEVAILFSLQCALLISHNLGGEKTLMDLSATDYTC